MFEKGSGEDRRWQETGRQFFSWLARHDRGKRCGRQAVAAVLERAAHTFRGSVSNFCAPAAEAALPRRRIFGTMTARRRSPFSACRARRR